MQGVAGKAVKQTGVANAGYGAGIQKTGWS